MSSETPDEIAKWAAAFGSLMIAADRDTRLDVLRRLGRHLLVKNPILEGSADPDDKDFETNWTQEEWADAQLYDALPEQTELDGLDDWKYETLTVAWPDGFDEVVFNDGADDGIHARELVTAYLEKANELSIPLANNFGATDEEMERDLEEHFVALIRKWRGRVIELLT